MLPKSTNSTATIELSASAVKDFIGHYLAPIEGVEAAETEDYYYMNLAIEEAKKGLYTTRPNPAVGCIIVKNGLIIGSG